MGRGGQECLLRVWPPGACWERDAGSGPGSCDPGSGCVPHTFGENGPKPGRRWFSHRGQEEGDHCPTGPARAACPRGLWLRAQGFRPRECPLWNSAFQGSLGQGGLEGGWRPGPILWGGIAVCISRNRNHLGLPAPERRLSGSPRRLLSLPHQSPAWLHTWKHFPSSLPPVRLSGSPAPPPPTYNTPPPASFSNPLRPKRCSMCSTMCLGEIFAHSSRLGGGLQLSSGAGAKGVGRTMLRRPGRVTSTPPPSQSMPSFLTTRGFFSLCKDGRSLCL